MMILTALFLFLLALIFAFLEIEIEGKYGWAEKSPTWYKKSRIFSFFNSKKPLTGYHLFMLIFIFLIIHLVFFVGLSWSLAKELQIISYYFIFFTTEDFLWFVFNPHYKLKNFKKNKIWWHYDCKWILGKFPLDYVFSIILTILLNYFSSIFSKNPRVLIDYLSSLGVIFILIFVVLISLPKIYERWYFSMRKKDERKKFNIFH